MAKLFQAPSHSPACLKDNNPCYHYMADANLCSMGKPPAVSHNKEKCPQPLPPGLLLLLPSAPHLYLGLLLLCGTVETRHMSMTKSSGLGHLVVFPHHPHCPSLLGLGTGWPLESGRKYLAVSESISIVPAKEGLGPKGLRSPSHLVALP